MIYYFILVYFCFIYFANAVPKSIFKPRKTSIQHFFSLVPNFEHQQLLQSLNPNLFDNQVPTNDSFEFTVKGEPIPLGRHRVARGHMFNPSAKFQKSFLKDCQNFLPSSPFEGPLEATLVFYFSRPKNHFRTGKFSHLLKHDSPTWHTKRKDIDNLIKFVLDALNERAYLDDGQIVAIHSYKAYTDLEPRVYVHIKKVR